MKAATVLMFTVVCLALGSCATKLDTITPASDGFDAIRFRRTVQVRDYAINTYTFRANSVFIADRRTEFGTLYCGLATINDDIRTYEVCLGFKPPSTIVIAPGATLKFTEVERALDPQDIEQIKVKS
jgi:hypothetical protein